MTIAMCYMSPEGVVLGADSTSSALISSGPGLSGFHYLNHNQKLFELGDDSTVGILTWGLAGLGATSYRSLFAYLADDIKATPPRSLEEIAMRWSTQFWAYYHSDPEIKKCLLVIRALEGKPSYDPADLSSRTKEEEQQLAGLRSNLFAGFCIAGYCLPDRTPKAFQIWFSPNMPTAPTPQSIPIGNYAFWGMPNMIKRLMFGVDENIKNLILQSGKWTGTDQELTNLLSQFQLGHPVLPLRDAIDFVHSCIYSTIKAMKFSNLFQVCGGPIEIAVISTDRRFRWVRHKPWDTAIAEGALS